ncbi:hemin transporter [Corynebacterium sp. TAE3-ERU12]|uniref:FAD-binding oxidoreductase n=1 Tax=Corynebacterium sp. TAE3-ERU12 TaxID=2849491 RepID=UPI001C44216F|nr:FAD-binding oxidoreductase [Corynebacterium sp. TAE3-ERU12]MBV7296049.1 hemin transporter [Corynebacterium sp. TAE3-ERU12]
MSDTETLQASPAALTPDQEEIIRATLPTVGANIETIASNFYGRMFGAQPELLNDTFNRGNQKMGAQQKALAASVATFATCLVDPNSPTPEELLSRIGHKHVSVGIVAGQYAIVHHHLFDAIEEVLTPEVFSGAVREAWDAVYAEMQRVLINFENELYDDAGVTPGDVFRATTVVERTEVGPDVVIFGVRGSDTELPSFTPGQYISVRREMADGARQLRQYSLINNATDGVLRFAVRRVDGAADLPAGEVSNSLWESLHEGDELEISLPAGDLVLDTESDKPVVLISGGIGATPMAGMLSYLAAQRSQRTVVDLHADRSEAADVLAKQRAGDISALPNGTSATFYEPELIDLGPDSKIDLPADADYYLCGSNGFLQAIRAQLDQRGIDRSRVHFELFSPNDWLLDA